MANPRKKAPVDIEPDQDAWGRFERAVDAAVKSGPIHEKPALKGVTKKERPASKGRDHKEEAGR